MPELERIQPFGPGTQEYDIRDNTKLPVAGGTISGNLNVAGEFSVGEQNKLKFIESSEGGNVVIYPPDSAQTVVNFWEIDAYNGALRLFADLVAGGYKFPLTLNGNGSVSLGSPLTIANGGTGASTAPLAVRNLQALGLGKASSEIPGGVDLNSVTYMEPGVYGLTSTSIAQSILNCPTTNPGTLRVWNALGDNSVVGARYHITIQEYIDAFGDVWTRRCNENPVGTYNWEVWAKLYSSKDIIPISSGGTGQSERGMALRALIGAESYSGDMDSTTVVQPGVYWITYENVTNIPGGYNYGWWIILPHNQISSRNGVQIFVPFNSEGSPRVYYRLFINNRYYPWRFAYTYADDAASQASRIPIGSVVYRGYDDYGLSSTYVSHYYATLMATYLGGNYYRLQMGGRLETDSSATAFYGILSASSIINRLNNLLSTSYTTIDGLRGTWSSDPSLSISQKGYGQVVISQSTPITSIGLGRVYNTSGSAGSWAHSTLYYSGGRYVDIDMTLKLS